MYTISSNNTLCVCVYCIATHILTTSTIPVTSTPLEANCCMVWRSPLQAASHILVFSSYNYITTVTMTTDYLHNTPHYVLYILLLRSSHIQ